MLTLGENRVAVTPRSLAAFLGAIAAGGGTLMSSSTARKLRTALEGVVEHGTATQIRSALNGTLWRVGGKTGTGPGQCADACDGWFASILSDRTAGRYVILAFIERQGLGGGVAARTAAMVAKFLITR